MGEGGFESLALGLAEREVSFPPHDQRGPVGEGGQAGFDLADRPTLIVWGERDFAFGQAERERFESAFPQHQTVLYPDASHFLQEDAGDHIAEQIRAFRADTAIG